MMRNFDLLPSANNARLGLIGNPENRRVRDFTAAVEALSYPSPAFLSWTEILRDSTVLDRFDVDLLRIDSPGENEQVARELIARGGGPSNAALEFGEIGFLKEYHQGLCQILDLIEQRGIPCLNSPREIAVMFDKWESHQRFAENGITRPRSTLAQPSFNSFWEHLQTQPSGQLFLKPLHGSSASGVCAFRWMKERFQLIAPIKIQSTQGRIILLNSLEVCTYSSIAEIETILSRLLPQGMISEQWIPKLSLPGGAVDLRVLVIDGAARHWVVRQSQHPMTNLHLGNARGDEKELFEIIGPEKLDAAFRLAEAAAACFPESLYAGVDILLDARHRAYVGEINAFGDLLPRLVHRGESAYSAIARICHAQRCAI